jgi:hypothetical protein
MQKILRDGVTGAIPKRITPTCTCAAVRPSQRSTYSALLVVAHQIRSSASKIMFKLSFINWKCFGVAKTLADYTVFGRKTFEHCTQDCGTTK